MLSQKNVQMLMFLCDCAQEDIEVTVSELATRFHNSSRMVRYNLEQIDYHLTSNGFPRLKRQKGGAIQLESAEDVPQRVRQMLEKMQDYAYILSREERERYILIQLFDAEEPTRYEDLAETLSVTRKTVIADVRNIREAQGDGVLQIRPTKRGIVCCGEEASMRRMAIDKMLECFTARELYQIACGGVINKSIPIERKWLEVNRNSSAKMIDDILRQMEMEQGHILNDEVYYLLVILTTLAINRVQRGHATQMEDASAEGNPYPIEESFFARVEERLRFALNPAERRYIACEIGRILQFSSYEDAEKMAGIITESLLINVGRYMNRNYSGDDVLRGGLQKHLFQTCRTGLSHYHADEVTLRRVIEENDELYRCVCRCAQELSGESAYALRLSELECKLITLHFAAADERRSFLDLGMYKALVVCVSGVGSARLVSAKIEKYFPQICMVDTTSIHNMQAVIQRDRPDIILTTIPLELETKNIPAIRVSPLLTESDMGRIRAFMEANPKKAPISSQNAVYEELYDLIVNSGQMCDEAALVHHVKRILERRSKSTLGLMEMIREECILLDVEAEDWEEAVRKSAEPLIAHGYIEPRYLTAMLENIRKMGSYVVVAPGIAIPHSLPKDGVLRACMSLAVLKHPVCFGNEYNDPVKIVLCMGTRDSREHMQSISELTNLLGDTQALAEICAARTSKAVMRIIRDGISDGTIE